MKKVILLTAVLLLAVTFSNSFCEKNYEIEKAIITYKLSGMQTGTMEIAFDKHGEYVSMTTNVPGHGKSTTIMTPDESWMIDWNKETAMDLNMLGDMEDDGMGIESDLENESKIVGKEKILGKNATIYLYKPEEGGTAKYWIWKSVMLKTVTEINGISSIMEATSLKTPSSIPAKTFKVPKNIKKQGMPSFSLPIPGFGN